MTTSMERVRVAMIGAGSMARRVHYPSLASFPDVEMVAVSDLDEKRLFDASEAYQIDNTYLDFRQMIEETAPQAVYSIGPPGYMYDTWIWCLEHGLNLFIEKPLGITMHQADMLAELAARNGCITQVGFQRRTSPVVVSALDQCLERGQISHAVVRFTKFDPRPFRGALDHMLDDGTHAIDTLRFICGGEVTNVHGELRRSHTPDLNVITALLSFSSGATGSLNLNWNSGRRVFSVEMHAPGICAEVDTEGLVSIFTEGSTIPTVTTSQNIAGSDDFYIYGGFRAKNREFIDAILGDYQPASSFADAWKTMRVAHQLLAQHTLSL